MMYTASNFPVTDQGSKWLMDNFISTGRIATVTNIILASEDPQAVRFSFSDGTSGKLSVGYDYIAKQVVAAWTLWKGTGASAPSDPVSTSANNLVQTATQSIATNSTVSQVSNKVVDVATKTGMPVWAIWAGGAFGLLLIVRWLWRKLKKRRR